MKLLSLVSALALLVAPLTAQELQKAFVTAEHVKQALAAEEKLAASYDVPPPAGEPWFRLLPGNARVLVVAGHATAQTREGNRKPADAGTGSLAFLLNRLAGTPVLQSTWMSPSDSNYYDDNGFKEELARQISTNKPVLVLDLHASQSGRPYDVDFGTMDGKSLLGHPDLLQALSRLLRNEGMVNQSLDFFAAAKQATVTKWVSGRGVPCIQLEVSTTCLPSPKDPLANHRFAQLLQGLVRFIRSVDPAARPLEAPGPQRPDQP